MSGHQSKDTKSQKKAQQELGIGEKIKRLRKHNKITLKQLSEKTGLSTGFLSQVERGLSTIAIDSLSHILKVFNVELGSFFQKEPVDAGDSIMRSYEQRFTRTSPRFIESLLTYRASEFNCLPRMLQVLPAETDSEPPTEVYIHEGEEILYILEGVLTMYIDGNEYALFPGDCVQLHSNEPHNWSNRTKGIVRFLQFNYPNPYALESD